MAGPNSSLNRTGGNSAYNQEGRLVEAPGKYVSYLDDDDLSYPEHLDYSIGFLERNSMIGLSTRKR